MDFRTRIQITEPDIFIKHSTELMLFGSCFSENIGIKLLQNKFKADVNPFGILYNPFSVSNSIKRLISGEHFSERDLVCYNGMYHSFMHHGHFSDTDKQVCLEKIMERFERAASIIRNAGLFLITFGTAYIYKWKDNGMLVSNCHKFPACRFHRSRLQVEEIVEEWNEVITQILSINPDSKFIFTVSPVRHLKDGAHENQVSKSILHLAVDSLRNGFAGSVYYFPAYEVMIDELRDYRFYEDDMIHPSPFAIDYIWHLFAEAFFSCETREVNREWEQIRKAIFHRPLHPTARSYKMFLEQTLQKLELFSDRHPEIECEEERALLKEKLYRS